MSEPTKYCPACDEHHPLSAFGKDKSRSDGRSSLCRDAKRKKDRTYDRENPQKRKERDQLYHRTNASRLSLLRTNARRRGIEVHLTLEEFEYWFSLQPQECHYCGVTEETLDPMGFRARLELDRKDSSGAYETGNLVLACPQCNNIKGNFFSYEEMLEIATRFIRPKRTRERRD